MSVFRQIDTMSTFTTKPVGEGAGLGLDIVQPIVRQHKGSIRVDCKPGRTVFQVRPWDAPVTNLQGM